MKIFLPFVLLASFFPLFVSLDASEPSPIIWKPLGEPGCGGRIVSLGVNPHRPCEVLVGGDMLGVGFSYDRGEIWQPVFGFKSVEMGDFSFHPTDPRIVWGGSLSGPYRSDDGGKTWVERRNGMPKIGRAFYTAPIEKVLFDPNAPRRLLAFGGNSRRMSRQEHSKFGVVWESRDSGETWREIGFIPSAPGSKNKGANLLGAAFAAGSGKLVLAAAENRGVLRSDDGGKTWKESNAGLPQTTVERIVAHPAKSSTFWVSLNPSKREGNWQPGSVFKSEDGGLFWTEIGDGLPKHRHAREIMLSVHCKAFDVSRSNPEVMYLGDASWNGGGIYKTVDGGKKWTCIFRKNSKQLGIADVRTAYPAGSSMEVLTVDPTDENKVYTAGSEYVLRTVDGGKTWEDVTAIRLDGGWRGRGYSGLCSINFRFDPFVEGRAVLLAMDAGKCWESLDGLKTWNYRGQKPGAWGGGNDATFARDGRVYVTTGQFGSHGGILRSEKPPEFWMPLGGEARGLPPENSCRATGIYTLPDDSAKVWAVVGARLYHSVDSGESWKKLSGNAEGLPDVACGWIAADARNPNRFYVSAADSVYETENGTEFRAIDGPRVAGRMTVDPEGRLYLAAYRGKRPGLWRYEPGERPSWRRLKDDYHLSNVAVDPVDPSRILVSSNDDPYHDHVYSLGASISSDRGETWTDENAALPVRRGTAAAFDPFDSRRIVFGTGGCGFFVAEWPRNYKPKGNIRYEHTKEDADFAASRP